MHCLSLHAVAKHHWTECGTHQPCAILDDEAVARYSGRYSFFAIWDRVSDRASLTIGARLAALRMKPWPPTLIVYDGDEYAWNDHPRII